VAGTDDDGVVLPLHGGMILCWGERRSLYGTVRGEGTRGAIESLAANS
jgi:hypothetical protein